MAMALCIVSVAAQQRSRVVMKIDNENYYIHRPTAGQTVQELSLLYGLTEEEIRSANKNFQSDTLTTDVTLRIPCWERTSRLAPRRSDSRYERHAVQNGESLMDVAINYAISLDTLIVDNPGMDITDISSLRTLNIRKDCTRKTQIDEIEAAARAYAELLGLLSTRYHFITVEAGQTIYSLAAAYCHSPEELANENGNPNVLQTGQVLKCAHHASPTHIPFATTTQSGTLLDSLTIEPDEFRRFDKEVLTVSLLLPLTSAGGTKIRGSFVEFYQGALLAAEDLKRDGKKIELHLFDIDGKDAAQMDEYVRDNEVFERTDLFIGPVYEEGLEPLSELAATTSKTIVSPLASNIEGEWGRHLYRLAPTDSTRLDKLAGIIGEQTNVILVYPATYDQAMEQEMLTLLGEHPYGKVIYNEQFEVDSLNSSPIEELMVKDDNLFMVLSDNEIDTDRSLAIISSMMNSRQSKYGIRRVPIRVIGNANWARYKNMDKNLLFKLDVSFLAPYHADRSNERTKEFDRRFIEAFGRQPSTFAYRAYDALKLFGSAIWEGGDLTAALNGSVEELLQVPYSFVEERGIMVNDAWPLINYRPNYTIEVR